MVFSSANKKFLVFIVKWLVINSVLGQLGTNGFSMRKSRAIISRSPTKGDCGVQNYTGKIRGGLITELDEFPWNVLLIYAKSGGILEHGCGGVLIAVSFVLKTYVDQACSKFIYLTFFSPTMC